MPAKILPKSTLNPVKRTRALYQRGRKARFADGVSYIPVPGRAWFIGVQYHPELKSRPFEPHPLFASFIAAAKEQSRLV